MNDQFDELAKGLAQSVTRRGALKKFGVGLAGIVLASLGLANTTQTQRRSSCQCKKPDYGCGRHNPETAEYIACVDFCRVCCAGGCF